LVEAAPDAMVVVGNDGCIVLVNNQTEQLFGYSRSELLGQPIEILIPPRFHERHTTHRSSYFSKPRARGMGEALDIQGLRKDGSVFPIDVSLSPLQLPGGNLVCCAVRDITHQRNTERALELANRELEAFSYSVAHDLRAPLRGVNGFAQILLEGYADKLDDEARDCLQEIRKNAVRMGALIDALLALSRVTRSELSPSWVDLSSVAQEIWAQLKTTEPRRRVAVSIDDDLKAYIDPTLGRVLLDNLLENAWKSTRDVVSARVELGAYAEGDQRVFFVRDNGAGFDPSYADKLFVPFQRLHTVSEFPGTGIGLATAQRIVHRHGGRIWAWGEVGAGAAFYFTLPARTNGARG
jgi:PAS domain S-box-containing protein